MPSNRFKFSIPLLCGLSWLLPLGCGKSDSSPDLGRVPVAPVTRTQNADGTIWHVTSKSCNSESVSLSGSEKLQFENSEFAHIYLTKDDANTTCSEADVFGRVIQDSHVQDNIYTEKTSLTAQNKRVVCTDKNSNNVISDDTGVFSDTASTMTITLGLEYGTAAVNGSSECPNGTLNFHLKRK